MIFNPEVQQNKQRHASSHLFTGDYKVGRTKQRRGRARSANPGHTQAAYGQKGKRAFSRSMIQMLRKYSLITKSLRK